MTFAVFSEAEGNEVLLGLRKGSAKLSPQKGQININNSAIIESASNSGKSILTYLKYCLSNQAAIVSSSRKTLNYFET